MSELFDRIGKSIEASLKPEMEAMRDDVKDRISVPVDKTTRPWTRSKPGEPPRKDTGRLHASASTQILEAGDVVNGSVSVNTPYAKRLNNEMSRPIFGPTLQNHAERIKEAVRRGITSTPKE